MPTHPLLRLVRPALAPTAAADVLAGAAFAGGTDPWHLAAAVAASVCLYTGGMAQNDLCDRCRDTKLHPHRPLVAHPDLVKKARILVAALFVAGLVAAAFAGTIWPALAVAALASAYNWGLKRVFPADALTLGAARAANLALGLWVAGAVLDIGTLAYPACYLLFIAAVTAASRAEDMSPAPTRRLALLLAFFPQALAFGGLAWLTRSWIVLLLPLALQAIALQRAVADGSRPAVMRYILRSLLMIFCIHAACLWAVGAHRGIVGVVACGAVSLFLLARMVPAPAPPQEV